uniref:Uncharacterized protein n=1 Tax=Candidatus Kentrum eta TaxID=2126337 RepID=A0A450UGZ8_9GAMM|nr:MAG: hypothetical protein BECKH772A_GA0070896_1002323 [Candidatus Kentron sp. H]VFJ91801.1 MAG: hypothetical protein BECKH772B_GA0070898_1002123 [Candidatus Kentron sp. H]VFJ98445.1 MAG: hypothetical protein BECKH772C_GA0070978_1002123 [Candidatus Kentron sp. H]
MERKKPTTVEQFIALVDEALFEIEELRASMAYDDEDITDDFSGFIQPLQSGVRDLRQQLANGSHEFVDCDLAFMAVVAAVPHHLLPFGDLLSFLNQVHREGLGVDASLS